MKHLFACLLWLPVFSFAQDANYWSDSYGPGGFFAPGAVIANNRDSGVLFVNPALLAYTRKSSASISGNLYQYESIRVRNGVGTGLDLTSRNGSVIPEAGAGIFAFRRWVVGYALTRNPISVYSVTQRRDAHADVLDDSYSPGAENYVGQYAAQNDITETSGVVSLGFKAAPGLALGVTAEGQVRSQDFSTNFSSRALYNVTGTDTLFPPIASAVETYEARYTHIGLRLRFGLAYDAGRHHLGVLLVTPLLHLFGRATLYSDEEVNDILLGGVPINLLANARQTGLPARWKTPASFSAGYAYDYGGGGQVYVAVSYFTRIGDYNVVTPRNDYFIRPDTGSNNASTSALLKFKSAGRQVFNIGAGCSFPLRSALLGYVSFRTDYTSAARNLYRDDDGYVANTTAWNQYHLELGVNLKRLKYNFRPGIALSYGATSSYRQPFNFDDPNESNLLTGNPHQTRASRFSAGLLLAYIHNL